ncbi:MAG: GldG family protein [Clostridiales bacterium]|nr:GldG family protein [Clostridiales bacterium]
MSKLKNTEKRNLKRNRKQSMDALNTRTAKVGGYSFIVTVIVLAILVLANVAVSSLPSTWTQFDISATQLYSVTSSTKSVAQNLTEEVTIYWITQEGEEDTVIEKLLNVYDALSDNITVEKKNPDIYPTFASQYTDETVENNSLIVESGDTYRYIAYSDIYESDYSDYYTTGSVSSSFDGESEITTAIDYVVSEDLPVIYLLTGHGESDLSESLSDSIEKANIETEELSLLTVDEIPEDADAILVYAPTSDISEEEADMLTEYMDEGGRLFVMSGPQEEDEMTNLHSVLENYGITAEEGIVVEGNRDNYAFGYPYVLLPELGDSDITSELSESNNYIIVPIAQGLTIGDTDDSVTVTSLLTTTSESFSKIAGYSLDTYDKEDGDIDGEFSVAVSVEDSDSGAMMIWISSDGIMEDTYVSYSSGANSDFVMNAVSWLIGETDSISIRSKSLSYSYLTISTSQANIIKVCLIAVIPLCYLFFGIEDMVRRRKKS